ncbi:P22AR C-terminal domain-containing protein [Seminibacterium arietis]|uniref:P22AR C-terminal domain-containing protein n=1 Tax=Seminibacterium arietis TaxID=1173502 RepID=A0ABW3I6S2_9PAST
MRSIFLFFIDPLAKLGSVYAPNIYEQAFEYTNLIKRGHAIIQRLTATLQTNENNRHLLKHIQQYNPNGKNLQLI